VNENKDEESLNGSNGKCLSVRIIGNSYTVKSGLEASSEVGSGRSQVVNKRI